MKDNIVIIIPAYNPNEELCTLIKRLRENDYINILVINDGSENLEIFNKINSNAIILNHKENMGKGVALKTGFDYCLRNFKNASGVITVDADGQHLVKDINKVYEQFINNNDKIIFGSRNFNSSKVPLRSRIGNVLFRNILRLKIKAKIKDTQTGLRAIPIKYLKKLKEIKGERFEYETNMLIYFIKNKIDIIEVNIETVYINKNKTSNYKVIKDSIKIINQL